MEPDDVTWAILMLPGFYYTWAKVWTNTKKLKVVRGSLH